MRRFAPLALLIVPLLLAGCVQPTPAYVTDWAQEARAHGPKGVEANMSITAEDYIVIGEGEGRATSAPFAIAPGMHMRGGNTLFFQGTVLGVGTGLIILEGERLAFTNGTLDRLPVDRVASLDGSVDVHLRAGPTSEKPQIEPGPERDDLRSALFFSDGAPITARDLVIHTADRAEIFMEGNVTELTLPIRFDAEYLAFHPSGSLRFDTFTATFTTFGYGGTTETGNVRLTARPDVTDPTAVFGTGATLTFTPEGVGSANPFRLTQASTTDGYVLEATVELRAEKDEVQVPAGNTTWSQVRYRESGYVGSAILENVSVTGDAATLVRVPLASPPWMIETLWDSVQEAGLGGLFIAPGVAVASPFIFLAEAFAKGLDCAFNDCPSEHPYPVWIEPGQVGRFYYHVDATDAAPGTYEGTIVFRGASHDTATLPVRIVVTAD